MSARKGLTWSGKWHIVNDDISNLRYDISLCGAFLYNAEKENDAFGGRVRFPEHLQKIINGTRKSTGDCKRCAKSAGHKTLGDNVIDSAVRLNLLDYGSIVRGANGHAYEKQMQFTMVGRRWLEAGNSSPESAESIPLPATLLWKPENGGER